MTWITSTVGECLAKVKRPGKLQTTDYQESGQFPIIDQGEGDIAGYTDQSEVVIQEPLPLVIFGDHTRRVKLAKEPFACGADGTQLLYPNRYDLDPTFFFYAIKSIDLSNYFYARHFKFLKEQEFSFPLLPTQRRIADVLSAYDDLIETNRRRMALLEEAARQLYREWFVCLRFPGHEHTPITNGVPEGWEPKTLGDLCEEIRETVKPETLDADTPYIGLEHMPRRSIALSEWGTAEQVTSSKHRFREGEILFGKIRPYFHKVGVAFLDGVASSDAIVIRPVEPKVRGFVLMMVSSDPFVAVTAQTMREGSKMPRADWKQMRAYPTPLPPDGLLGSFESAIRPIVEQLKSLTFANQKLRAARDLLLPRLMSGEIAV
jgi:type I restriction enzyme S subunit